MFEANATQLNLEITTRCSSNCIMCPHDMMERKNKDMEVEDIMEIVSQVYDMGIRKIHPHFFGEPTMHPDYVKIIEWIHNTYPDVALLNYTNGWGLSDEKIRSAIVENLRGVIISIEGATHETMKKVRPGLDPVKIEEGVRRLQEVRGKRLSVVIRMTVMPENRHEADVFREKWTPYCDRVIVARLQDFHGFKEMEVGKRSERPCDRPFWSMVITVNKNMVLCCDDYSEEIVLGSVDEESVVNIWNGDKMRGIRQLHLDGRLREIPMCADCSYCGCLK